MYCDGVLRGEKGVAEDDASAKLAAFMALFRLLAAKDVFEAFYKASLAKRLLTGKSQSFELEVIFFAFRSIGLIRCRQHFEAPSIS